MPSNPYAVKNLIVPGVAGVLAAQAADERRRLAALEAQADALVGKIAWRRTRLARIEAAQAQAERIAAAQEKR